jgi:hypothetical protein
MRESKLTSEHPTGVDKERGRELWKNLNLVELDCLAAFIEVRYMTKKKKGRVNYHRANGVLDCSFTYPCFGL